MADLKLRSEAKHQSDGQQVTVDLSDLASLSSLQQRVGVREVPDSFLKELNRGAIGHTAIKMVAGLFLLLPLSGGLIAAFGSVSQAQAFTNTVVAIFESLTRFGMVIVWPIIAYYFARTGK